MNLIGWTILEPLLWTPDHQYVRWTNDDWRNDNVTDLLSTRRIIFPTCALIDCYVRFVSDLASGFLSPGKYEGMVARQRGFRKQRNAGCVYISMFSVMTITWSICAPQPNFSEWPWVELKYLLSSARGWPTDHITLRQINGGLKNNLTTANHLASIFFDVSVMQ